MNDEATAAEGAAEEEVKIEKIDRLTPEQQEECRQWRQKYFELGWSTEPADRPRAERGIRALYVRMGLDVPKGAWCPIDEVCTNDGDLDIILASGGELSDKEVDGKEVKGVWVPPFVWFDSPLAVVECIKESTGEGANMSGVDGQLDAYWAAFYTFCRHLRPGIYKPEDDAQLDEWLDVVESTGPCWPYENFCLMSERPVKATYDDRELLHCDDGPALLYKDGLAIYSINGVRIPGDLGRIAIEEPWNLTLEQIEEEQNEDVKLILQARWCHEEVDGAGDRIGSGGGRWLEETGCTCIHEDVYTAYGDVAIMRALLVDKNGRKFLCCNDSSTDRVYYIQVAREANTCEEAHMSINGGIPDGDIVVSS